MPTVAVTTGSPDRRMGNPADLVARDSAITTAEARLLLDRVSQRAASAAGLGFPPWRQTYTLGLHGSGTGFLPAYAKPIESVTTVADDDGGTYTDYVIGSNGSGIADRLERDAGWGKKFNGGFGLTLTEWNESEQDAWTLTGITEGWLMPGQVSIWVANTAYVATIASTSYDDAAGAVYAFGSWVSSYNPAVELRFACTTGGTSHASIEPAGFATASAGDTITDGTATWTARAAKDLPKDLEESALLLAMALYHKQDRDLSVKSHKDLQGEIVYRDDCTSGIIEEMWGPYR